jgi:PAS domain S-box-containing protein
MLIKTQLRLAAVLPAVFALLIGGLLWIATLKVDQAERDAEMAAKIRVANFELNILTQEYLLYGGARVESQIRLRHRSMRALLDRMTIDSPAQRDLISALRQGHEQLGSFHVLLLEGTVAAREQIVGALLVKAQDIRRQSEQLADLQHMQVVALQRRANTLVILAIAALAASSMLLLSLMARRLIGGVRLLGEGMRRVADGDLEHAIPNAASDELGALAHSFNSMSDRLKESYTSIGKLEDEVARRKKVEEALIESEDKFRYMFEYSSIGKSITSPGGQVFVNQSFCDLLGRSREEMLNTRWQEITHPEDIAPTQQAIDGLLSGEQESARFIKRYLHKNGAVVWVDVSTSLRRDAAGAPLYFMSNVIDITDRKRAEDELHQLNAELERRVAERTATLQAANMELEAFSYSVSHDLRAPLRAIDGFSRKVMAGHGDRLDAEGRRQLQVVRDNAQRMGQLIDDLLAFSRMGRREMARQVLDMNTMVASVVAELAAAEPHRAIQFAVSPLPTSQGDAAMIRQVWVNLLSNAVKFSRQRAVAHIAVGGGVENGEARYWVRDDGAGFDMQYGAKLFGVFQRLHRQDEFEGTGVGLAIAQRILHRHNGSIRGEGKPDAGATFSFALPLAAPDPPVAGEPPP